MLNFTTNITVPNVLGGQITMHQERVDSAGIYEAISVTFGGAGGFIHAYAEVQVRNGTCVGWLANPAPSSSTDLLLRTEVDLPSGLDNLYAATAGTSSRAARLLAAETYLESVGLLPDGTVS